MDLAEKRKTLEKLKAEREAKRRMVHQTVQASAAAPTSPSDLERPGAAKVVSPPVATPEPEPVSVAPSEAKTAAPTPSAPLVGGMTGGHAPHPIHSVTGGDPAEAVARNGYAMLEAWDDAAALPPNDSRSSHAAALLQPTGVLQGHHSSPPQLPSITELRVGLLPHVLREEAAGECDHTAAQSESAATAVVIAAAYTTTARFTADFAASTGRDVLSGAGGLLGAAGALQDRATSLSGFSWGSTLSSPSSSAGTKFGSEVDTLLIAESAGLVLVYILLPAVYAEKRQVELGKSTSPVLSADMVVVVPLVGDADVRTILLHPHHPGMLLGGTRSGRVLAWSFTAPWASWSLSQLVARCMASTGTRHTLVLPCQRPSASTFPVPGSGILKLAMLGEANAHQLYGLREDGSITSWAVHRTGSLKPVATRLAYQHYSPLGLVGTSGAFAVKHGAAGALTHVFLGTHPGTVLVGTPRDAKAVDYAALWQPERSGGALGATPLSSSRRSTPKPSPLEAAEGTGDRLPVPGDCWSRHTGRVSALSPKTGPENPLLSCGVDGSALLWSGGSAPLPLTDATVTAVCWSPVDPQLFATGSSTGSVSLWRVQDAVAWAPAVTVFPSRPLEGHGATRSHALLPLSYTAEAQEGSLATGSDKMAAQSSRPSDPLSPITALEFSSDGRWLFAGYDLGTVAVIRLERDVLTSKKAVS